MNKIGVAVDSNSGMTQEEGKALGIYVLPMPVTIDGEEYLEGTTLTREFFFKKQVGDAEIHTSQPTPGNLMDFWDQALLECEKLIYIPMTSALSGSCENARMLAEDYNGRVLVVDNHRISITQRESALDALKMAEEGFSAEEIRSLLEESAGDSLIFLGVDTLKYLKKGGRITPATAALGTLLNIKPILIIDGGKLDSYAKARGKKHCRKALIECLKKGIEERFKEAAENGTLKVMVATTDGPEEAAEWEKEVRAAFPEFFAYNADLTISVATHTGPGAEGIGCVIPTRRKHAE